MHNPQPQCAKITALHYVLGEQTVHYNELADWQQRAAELSMPAMPEVWGWGSVYRTTSSYVQLAVKCAQKSLAEISAQEVDTIIFCSTSIPADPDEQTQLLCTLAESLSLNHVEIVGVTLGRCTNLLKGLRLAQARINSGQSRQILVIASDCIMNERKRLENFALFSDGAASCLVCHREELGPGFDIIASAEKQDTCLIPQGLSAELAKAVNQQIFNETKFTLADVHKLFHTNVYFPLCNLKERQAGYSVEQLFMDNITRVGHCFSADPLINLIDSVNKHGLPEEGLFQLAASIPGARASVLLQKRKQK